MIIYKFFVKHTSLFILNAHLFMCLRCTVGARFEDLNAKVLGHFLKM